MKYLWDIIAEEDAERERKYLESIGPIGRVFDNDLQFCVATTILSLTGFSVGFLIGMML